MGAQEYQKDGIKIQASGLPEHSFRVIRALSLKGLALSFLNKQYCNRLHSIISLRKHAYSNILKILPLKMKIFR